MATQQPINIQEYVPNPQLGELLAFTYNNKQIPAVLTGFAIHGGWQITEIEYFRGKIVRRGVMEHHNKRLLRMDISVLNETLKKKYYEIIKILKK